MRTLVLAATVAVTLTAPLSAQTFGPAIPLFSSESEKGGTPALAAAPDGGFVAAWSRLDGSLVVRIFGADGTPLTPAAMQISPEGDTQYGVVHGAPTITALSTGGYAVVWTRATPTGDSTVRLRILDAAGQPDGPVVEPGPQPPPYGMGWAGSVAADAAGHFVAGWTPPAGSPRVQRFAADGTPATSEIEVAAEDSGPGVAALPDGRFLVGLRQAGVSNLFFQIFGPTGTALGSPVPVRPSAQDRHLHSLRISVAANRFVTVWGEVLANTPTDRVVARLWSTDGVPLGPEIVVSETKRRYLVLDPPQVAMRRDGGFLVLWNRDWESLVRQFDAKGRPVGGALSVPVSSGLRAGDIEAAGNGWWIGLPQYSHPIDDDGPWVRRLTASAF